MNFRRLVKALIPRQLFRKIEPFGHWLEAVLAQTLAGFPARGLKVIGVTGTDGKSTTCLLIANMLRDSGKKTAYLTTIAVDYGDGQTSPAPAHMTTAGVWQLVKMLKKVRANGAEWLVLETSSHALSQRRVWGVPFSVAVLTNISHEHLDYHGSMAAYQAAKLKLFKQTNCNHKGLRTGVINADDDSSAAFAKAISHPVTYGLKGGELRAEAIELGGKGSSFKVQAGAELLNIKCNLPGEFNVYNALAAVGAGQAASLTGKQIEDGIASTKSVPGRMEEVKTIKNFKIFIDYAVTPKALEGALAAAKTVAGKGRVLLVFGATGDRDKSKRSTMGQVAATGADKIFLTDDETHNEDPAAIRRAVHTGIDEAGGRAKSQEIADRQMAIKSALGGAGAGDVVLITGLGHQTTRNMGGKDQPWNDAEIVRELLK